MCAVFLQILSKELLSFLKENMSISILTVYSILIIELIFTC